MMINHFKLTSKSANVPIGWNQKKQPSEKVFEITILWGEEAVRDGKGIKEDTEKTYRFQNEREMNCFLDGRDECLGWFETEIKDN